MQRLVGGQPIEDVHDAAVGHQHNLLPQVRTRQRIDGAGHPLAQLHCGLTTRRCEIGVALAPAFGLLRPVGFNVGPGLAFKASKATFAQTGVQLHLTRRRISGLVCNGLRRGMGAGQVA